jgi:hypothetical protein
VKIARTNVHSELTTCTPFEKYLLRCSQKHAYLCNLTSIVSTQELKIPWNRAENHIVKSDDLGEINDMPNEGREENKKALQKSTVSAETKSVVFLPSRTRGSMIMAMALAQSTILHKCDDSECESSRVP